MAWQTLRDFRRRLSARAKEDLSNMMTQDRYMTFKEVCDMLQICRTTLWHWTHDRGLKTVKIGNMARIKESELQKFLAKHETGEQVPGERQTEIPARPDGRRRQKSRGGDGAGTQKR